MRDLPVAAALMGLLVSTPASPAPAAPLALVLRPSVSATAPSTSPVRSSIAEDDARFLVHAAMANGYAIDAARIAVQRATDRAVLAFAGMMLEEHGSVQDELARRMARLGTAAPDRRDPTYGTLLGQLQAAADGDFDRAYIRQQDATLRETVALFERAATAAAEPAVAQLAAALVPLLRQQLAMARALHERVVPASSPGGG